MIEQEYRTIKVITEGDRACLRIEDKDSVTGILNLCWFNEKELGKLIRYLTEAKEKLETRKARIEKIISTTYFDRLYGEFEDRYNKYPVQMARSHAFSCALKEGLIDQDTYDAAERYYGRLWNYVGD